MCISRMSLCGLILLSYAIVFTNSANGAGLSVGPDGNLLKDGEPFRSIGVNYVDAFWRTVTDPAGADTSYVQGFETLGAMGINCARVAVSPFWPSRFQLFFDDEQEYFNRLDGVVQAAEDNNVGLIMSLFWADFTVPDLMGEPRNQWGNAGSATIAFMKSYTETIVSRYLNSPAVWVWEFGNEYSLSADLPNAADWRPPIVPELGTPLTRSADDDIFTSTILVAFQEFASTVRGIDTTRPITTGNSNPRNHAESIRLTGDWTEIDDISDYQFNMALVTPSPMDMISIHMYPGCRTYDRFAVDNKSSYEELLSLSMGVAATEKKPLFVGEWGASTSVTSLNTEEEVEAEFNLLLEAIIGSGAQLAAVWNFDYVDVSDDPWTITATNHRSYMLEAIGLANASVENKITRNPPGFVEEGSRLELTAPFGANYEWKKDGVPLMDDAPRVTGASSRVLILDPLEGSDSGVYTCEYGTLSIANVETEAVIVSVLPAGSLPVTSLIGLGLLAVVSALAGGTVLVWMKK